MTSRAARGCSSRSTISARSSPTWRRSGPARPSLILDPALGSVSAGFSLFAQNCAGCHQISAAGGYVPDSVAPPLAGDSARQIAEAVRIGPNLMPRFSRSLLSDRQLDSVIAYVRYTDAPYDRGGWSLGHVGPVPEGLVAWFVAGSSSSA